LPIQENEDIFGIIKIQMKENKKLKIIREWVQRFKTGKPEAYMGSIYG